MFYNYNEEERGNMEKQKFDTVKAFRKYARYGYDKAGFNIFEMCSIAKGATANAESAVEIVAVFQTMQALEFLGRKETADAVRAVYFRYASRPIKKNEVSWRVRRFATEQFMDERTVYRHLRVAKALFLNFYENGIKNLKKF